MDEKILGSDHETMFVAEAPIGIVGWIVFLSSNRIKPAHTGSVGMMMVKEFRNQGIGKLLIKSLLDWAE